MQYTVVTTFHQSGLEKYGQTMINTFEQFWPSDVKLKVYAEKCKPVHRRSTTEIIDLEVASHDMIKFKERHKDNPKARGMTGPDGKYDNKKQFKWDAIRFCHKVYALNHAINHAQGDWLIWLDADSKTHTTVTHDFLSRVCDPNTFGSYLGRGEKYHSECGWIAYNLNHPMVREFNNRLTGMYNSDEIFNLSEWHDSFVWDVVRKEFLARGDIVLQNLNPNSDTNGKAGHPFINSELGTVMDHMKGNRKDVGHSKAKEVVAHKNHPYWKKVVGQ